MLNGLSDDYQPKGPGPGSITMDLYPAQVSKSQQQQNYVYKKEKKRKTKSSENLGQRQLHWRIQWKLRCPQQEMIIVWFWIGGRNTSTFFFHFFFFAYPPELQLPLWRLPHPSLAFKPIFCSFKWKLCPTVLSSTVRGCTHHARGARTFGHKFSASRGWQGEAHWRLFGQKYQKLDKPKYQLATKKPRNRNQNRQDLAEM